MRRILVSLTIILAVTATSSKDAVARELSQDYKTAMQLADNGEFKRAIESYDRALAATPGDAACLARRGFAYACMGDVEKAFADFDAAIKSDAHCPDVYSRRSRVYAWLDLQHLSKEDAREFFEISSEVPEDPHRLLEFAGLLETVGKKKEADEEYRHVLAKYKKHEDTSAMAALSTAHRCLGHFQDSVYYACQALKHNPDRLELILLRSFAYAASSHFDLAIADLDRYIDNSGENPFALHLRGYCRYREGRFDGAISDYDKAIALARNFACAHCHRGMIYHDWNEHAKAIKDFSAAIELDSTNADAFRQRADNYCHQGEWKKALRDAEQATSLDPKFALAYLTRGWADEELGHHAEAAKDYNKAVALSPGDSRTIYARGMFYRRKKDYKKAVDDLGEAIKLDPKNGMYYCARGSALVSDHQYEKAIADCTQSSSAQFASSAKVDAAFILFYHLLTSGCQPDMLN